MHVTRRCRKIFNPVGPPLRGNHELRQVLRGVGNPENGRTELFNSTGILHATAAQRAHSIGFVHVPTLQQAANPAFTLTTNGQAGILQAVGEILFLGVS